MTVSNQESIVKKNNLFVVLLTSFLLYNIFTVSQIIARPEGDFPEVSDHSSDTENVNSNSGSSDNSGDSGNNQESN